MTTYKSNDNVAAGLYFNVRELRFVSMDDGGALPGDANDTFRRVHPLVLFLVGPFVGLVYAIFLPLIALAMVAAVLLRKAGAAIGHLFHRPTTVGGGKTGR